MSEDRIFLLICCALLCVGVGCLLSGSAYRAHQLFGDSFYFIRRHLLWIGLGILCSIFIMRIKINILIKYVPLLVGVTFILLLLTFVEGIGTSYLGVRRWIELAGITFQPSELAKVTLIFYLSLILTRRHGELHKPLHSLLPPLIVVVLLCSLVYLQNDFSTALLLFLLALSTFFLAGVPLRYFIGLGLILLPIATTLLFSHIHRVERLIAYLSPTIDPQGSGYQVLAAQSALQRGGWWGVGIGKGVSKFGALPEAHSDFIFAVIAEEIGLAGVLMIITIYILFLVYGIRISAQLSNEFERLLTFSIILSIITQVIVNIAVTIGLLPPTGIPLPFISSGGSSLIISIIMCSVVINIARTWRSTH